MPLRHVDPTRAPSAVARVLNRTARSRLGALMARYVAPKTDPWLSRISKGRVTLGMFNVPSATLTTTGAKSGQVRKAQIAYFQDRATRAENWLARIHHEIKERLVDRGAGAEQPRRPSAV